MAVDGVRDWWPLKLGEAHVAVEGRARDVYTLRSWGGFGGGGGVGRSTKDHGGCCRDEESLPREYHEGEPA